MDGKAFHPQKVAVCISKFHWEETNPVFHTPSAYVLYFYVSVIYLIKWETTSSSPARRNTYFSLEATMLIFIIAYVPGTVLCVLHISTLSILTKPSGSQPKVIFPTLIPQGGTRGNIWTHFCLLQLEGCYWIQQVAGKILPNTLQQTGQPLYNSYPAPNVNSANAEKRCNDTTMQVLLLFPFFR